MIHFLIRYYVNVIALLLNPERSEGCSRFIYLAVLLS